MLNHRLTEHPGRIAYIANITRDSDRRIDRFASPSGDLSTLPLRPLRKGEEYYLGMFLVGACRETLGIYII